MDKSCHDYLQSELIWHSPSILSCPSQFYMSNKKRNKLAHMKNGNRSGGNIIKISHWNIGSRKWQRKIPDIEAFIQEKNPDIFIITEANLWHDISDEERNIGGYELVLPKTMDSWGHARIAMLVKVGINFKVLDHCMDSSASSIWIQVGSRGRKPLKVGGLYREQHLLGYPTPNPTGTPNHQMARWNTLLEGWKNAASNDGKCVVLGDINLDFAKWNQQGGPTQD